MKSWVASVVCLIGVQGVAAQESRWVEVGGNSQITAYVDKISMRRSGAKVKVWLRWENASPVETDTVFPKKTYMSAKTLNVYNCSERSAAGLQAIRYAESNVSGDVVESTSIPETKATFVELAPETIGESIMLYACKATPGSKK